VGFLAPMLCATTEAAPRIPVTAKPKVGVPPVPVRTAPRGRNSAPSVAAPGVPDSTTRQSASRKTRSARIPSAGLPRGRDESSAGAIPNEPKQAARVKVRSGTETADLRVAAHSADSVRLPDGTYQVFFQFSDRLGQRFQGDDVSLHGTVAEIQLVSVANGNYGLRPVN